jgi:hypothetical protein
MRSLERLIEGHVDVERRQEALNLRGIDALNLAKVVGERLAEARQAGLAPERHGDVDPEKLRDHAKPLHARREPVADLSIPVPAPEPPGVAVTARQRRDPAEQRPADGSHEDEVQQREAQIVDDDVAILERGTGDGAAEQLAAGEARQPADATAAIEAAKFELRGQRDHDAGIDQGREHVVMRERPHLRPPEVEVERVAMVGAAVETHGLREREAATDHVPALGPEAELAGVVHEPQALDQAHAASVIEPALVEPRRRSPRAHA